MQPLQGVPPFKKYTLVGHFNFIVTRFIDSLIRSFIYLIALRLKIGYQRYLNVAVVLTDIRAEPDNALLCHNGFMTPLTSLISFSTSLNDMLEIVNQINFHILGYPILYSASYKNSFQEVF